ncbi:hypothetical protein, partial [Dictyobacter arantiisoli]|uniref:hypothetical protein n=1 Tax=Dictyobacter arantiisoli TaxID=2014874 RepID=UPI001C0F1F71
ALSRSRGLARKFGGVYQNRLLPSPLDQARACIPIVMGIKHYLRMCQTPCIIGILLLTCWQAPTRLRLF